MQPAKQVRQKTIEVGIDAQLLEDLKTNPMRYVHFSLFGTSEEKIAEKKAKKEAKAAKKEAKAAKKAAKQLQKGTKLIEDRWHTKLIKDNDISSKF